MIFLHLADLHLGKTLGDYNLIDDQKYILEQIRSAIKEKSVDAVLIAGDVFDRSIPAEAAVELLDGLLSDLADMGVKAFMISGNHDSEERLGYGGKFFAGRGIHVVTKFDGKAAKIALQDEHGPVNIYLLPFIKASQVRHFYPEERIDSYEDAVRTVIAHSEIDPAQRNVLVAHQFVSGDIPPKFGGSEGTAVQHVGTVEIISSGIFSDFDYVALGHLHSPQSVGRETVRYSGSLLKYSLSEAGDDKSAPIIEMGEKGAVDTELLPLKPRRDLRHIKGRLDQLLRPENIVDPEDFIYVTLTDEEIITDAMSILRQYYPNTVKIDYQNSHTREIESIDVEDFTGDMTFEELISDFYGKMYGTEISEEELAIMMEVAGEAGVVHEAD